MVPSLDLQLQLHLHRTYVSAPISVHVSVSVSDFYMDLIAHAQISVHVITG